MTAHDLHMTRAALPRVPPGLFQKSPDLGQRSMEEKSPPLSMPATFPQSALPSPAFSDSPKKKTGPPHRSPAAGALVSCGA